MAIEESTQARKGQLQNALDLLFEVYTTRLSEEHLDLAIDLLDNERKAAFFIGLPTGAIRDRWLERHAHIQVIQEDINEDIDYGEGLE
jgi:hypothetical protein